MARNFDITSANSNSILIVEDLYPVGITLEMFGTDSAISLDSLDVTETRMGVDGRMVAGITPNIHALTITLEAASPSYEQLGRVWAAMMTTYRIYECTLVSTVPSIGRVFTWTRGVMKSGVPFANLSRVLDPTTWVFHFEKLTDSGI